MRKNESGQALVLVLLSLSVVLTIVLYILSRTVTNVAVSSQQGESVRAFSAAEAGVENALVIGSPVSSSDIGNGASYNATVTGFSEGSQDFPYPSPLSAGDSFTTWFMAHDDNGSLTSVGAFTGSQMKVCWGNPNTDANSKTTPAIEVSVYYESTPGDASTTRIARAALDPYVGRTPPNSFAPAMLSSCQISGNSYAFQVKLSFSELGIPSASYNTAGGLQFARVKIFYNTDVAHVAGTTVDFAGNSVLPSQGVSIVSTGIAGGSNRRINVLQGWQEFPFGSEAVFSPPGITK